MASAAQSPVESSSFAPQLGVNDNSILHYDDQGGLNQDGSRREYPRWASPFVARNASAFKVEEGDLAGGGMETKYPTDVNYGIRTYEATVQRTAPGMVKPGSVVNFLY